MAPAHIAYALTNRKNLFVAGPVRPHLNRFVASGSSTTTARGHHDRPPPLDRKIPTSILTTT